MKTRLLYTFLFLAACCLLRAQLRCSFTHYSLEDGLSEGTVGDMVQDDDGLIWFATWDGINCFDGYGFRVYKAREGNGVHWASNRVDHLQVDAYGDVWCVAYDGRAFRFNKRMEVFEEVPADGEGKGLVVRSAVPLGNGTVWLLAENQGGIRVVPDRSTGKVSAETYLTAAAGQSGRHIHAVFLDAENREWLLTDGGLFRVDGTTGACSAFFAARTAEGEPAGKPFFSACAVKGAVLFGSSGGQVWRYAGADSSFTAHRLAVDDDVVSIRRLPGGRIIIATRRHGFALGDEAMGQLAYEGKGKFDFGRYPVNSVYVDSRGEVWFEVEKPGTVCHFNPQTRVFKVEQMAVEQDPADRSVPGFSACEDGQGNLWVHPFGGGLSWFDRANNRLLPFYDDPLSGQWRFSNKLYAMMVDRQGNLWLGTHSKGLEKITLLKDEFRLVKPEECRHDTSANQVRSLYEDTAKRIWVGTRDGKISVYSSNFVCLGHLTEDGRISRVGKPLKEAAYKMMEDTGGNLLIATKGNGIIRLAPRGKDAYEIHRYMSDPDDKYSLSSNNVYDLCRDSLGRIWVATFGGGINLMERRADGGYRFINSRNSLVSYPMERCGKARRIVCDGRGKLWVATSNGVLSFHEDFGSPADIVFRLHVRMPGKPGGLNCNDVYDMLETRSGRLFFATFGGGLNELVETGGRGDAGFVAYTVKDGLPADVLTSLAEDADGNVWIGTEAGLSRMDVSGHHFDNYLKQELGEELLFEENTALRAGDGRLMFGTQRGILSFIPGQIHKNGYVPNIVFSGLKVANEPVVPRTGSVLSESLNGISRLSLSHEENIVALSFAALDMTYPENVRYAYILDGFDKDWNYVGKSRVAVYTNLPKGDYVFRVKSTNGAGIWVDNERRLDITVLPSFWETPYAWVLYVLAFLAVLLGGAYILFVIYRLKHEVSVEQQLTDMKLRFFTNISHELRTPLTLIGGPLENVLRRQDLPDEARAQLRVVERNATRMFRLVNQILDFRKIQNHKMKLRVEQVDVVPFVRRIMENFEAVAESNQIDFIFESECARLKLWIDTDKVEKIVFNLLSNAFKYTPPGKSITMFIRENEDTAVLGVRDEGIGIPEGKRTSLFVRFETLLDKSLFNPNSSGIGLSLAKELVEMHHAEIHVESREGEGSCFSVEFRKGREHFGSEAELILSDSVEPDRKGGNVSEESRPDSVENVPGNGGEPAGETGHPEGRTMLLVEDNEELRAFLRSIFCRDFRILEASDGTEGAGKAIRCVPDIIISDIMMPGKDGIALTRELRGNLQTSHIPIVLLTAKTDMDSRLEGMEGGADSYITKPFSAAYLEARVNNLLESRQKLRRFYCEHLMDAGAGPADAGKGEAGGMPEQDRTFLDRLAGLMEKNMDNGELVVDDLVKEMAVSRSVFFKKLKSLTGLAPVEFIKEMRVKRAAQLIRAGGFSMTQIAYMVGINDSRYFSKCFKQRFGMTPTEYKDKTKSQSS